MPATKSKPKPLSLAVPTVKQVRAEISSLIKMFHASYREADGLITNEGAIWTIVCLERALELMPTKGSR